MAAPPTARTRSVGIRGRAIRWAVMFVAAAALAIAAGALLDRRNAAEPALDPAMLAAGYGPGNEPAARAEADRAVAGARAHHARGSGEWLRGEVLARALIERHRLAGDVADLAEAEQLLDQGLALAPDPAGPALTRAWLSLIVHRLPQAEQALARVARWAVPTLQERATATALAGDIAQQRGSVNQAARTYGEAEVLAADPGIVLRQVVLLARTGEREEARRRLDRLLARPGQAPRALAELALQRAQLAYAEGQWGEAERWVAAADRLFPEFWLTRAYRAQGEALAGRRDEAIRRYALVAARSRQPEVMDALAQLLRLEGDRQASMGWWRRADAIWRQRLARFPEAFALHAAEHALIGGRPAEALALAAAEAARRPHGDTLAMLARASLVSGRPRQALAALDRAEAQGWISAGLLMLRSEAAAALGDEAASADARRRAEALNPRAADPATRLIWFGHD